MYEEHVNPGDHIEWTCSEITRFMQEYDEFVDRADRFSLDDDRAARLWESHEAELPPAGALCSAYSSDMCKQCAGGDNLTDCCYELNLICILKLPVCAGVCRRYKHSQISGTASGCSR
ncbi:hypothetical protein [Halodesulfovibrio aestuarii]|uniref:Uncharacterized protein n=1 Tax=Halodesulfovibrio aestuarii TaxID=126333 RepID=A0ABV4JRD2_9BACT